MLQLMRSQRVECDLVTEQQHPMGSTVKADSTVLSYILYRIKPRDSHIVQFSLVAQSCPTLRDPMNCRTPGLPVHHQLPELTQTHVGDVIQPSHPLSFPSPPAPNSSQHQSLFQLVNYSHEVVKVLEFHL